MRIPSVMGRRPLTHMIQTYAREDEEPPQSLPDKIVFPWDAQNQVYLLGTFRPHFAEVTLLELKAIIGGLSELKCFKISSSGTPNRVNFGVSILALAVSITALLWCLGAGKEYRAILILTMLAINVLTFYYSFKSCRRAELYERKEELFNNYLRQFDEQLATKGVKLRSGNKALWLELTKTQHFQSNAQRANPAIDAQNGGTREQQGLQIDPGRQKDPLTLGGSGRDVYGEYNRLYRNGPVYEVGRDGYHLVQDHSNNDFSAGGRVGVNPYGYSERGVLYEPGGPRRNINGNITGGSG